MKGIVVISFDGEINRWNYIYIADNEPVYRGYIQLEIDSSEIEVRGYITPANDYTQYREETKLYERQNYYADAEGFNRAFIAELIGQEIINFINI